MSPSSGVGFTGRPIGTSRVGRYSGDNIRAWVAAWVDRQIQTASPPNYPAARERLLNLVGTWQGSGPFGIWQAPDYPDAIFRKLKNTGGIYPTFDQLEQTGLNLPDLGGICEGISRENWVYVADGGGGDPILGGSRLYELIRFRLFQNQYRECVNALCLAIGGPEGELPTTPTPPSQDNDTINLPDDSIEPAPWGFYAAVGLGAYFLVSR